MFKVPVAHAIAPFYFSLPSVGDRLRCRTTTEMESSPCTTQRPYVLTRSGRMPLKRLEPLVADCRRRGPPRQLIAQPRADTGCSATSSVTPHDFVPRWPRRYRRVRVPTVTSAADGGQRHARSRGRPHSSQHREPPGGAGLPPRTLPIHIPSPARRP